MNEWQSYLIGSLVDGANGEAVIAVATGGYDRIARGGGLPESSRRENFRYVYVSTYPARSANSRCVALGLVQPADDERRDRL